MKALKIIGLSLLSVLCLCVLVYCGAFLWQTAFPVEAEPQLPAVDALFDLEEIRVAPQEEEPEEIVEEVVEEEPLPPEDPAAELASAYLAEMTLEEKLWQLIFTTPDDLAQVDGATLAGETTKNALEEMPVGGLCYFSNNLIDAEQTATMLEGTQGFAKTPLFLATDEEGGVVSRLGSNEAMGVDKLEAAAVYGAGDVLTLRQHTQTLAEQMTALGFNMDFAPVADVLLDPNNTEIGTRAYSDIAAVAGAMSATMAETLQQNGIIACLKHFPGHGSTTADSHEGTSVSTRTLEQLRAEEFLSFSVGIDKGVKFVMMSHLTNENLSEIPSSLSPNIVGLLREELGFEGIIITDSLKMGAIVHNFTAADAAVKAIEAGCDMLLMPNSLEVAYDGLVNAVLDGTLTEERIDESVLRILTVKYEMGIMQ
ncbi:MAG: glycoside hydrolase family 3 [Oscillospiraceae bacterium]|nr:glycoside hydrolase family 3 [Oscillospiraceae bacterium]